MKFESIKPGMTLYSVDRKGNSREFEIVSVDPERRTAVTSTSGRESVWFEARLRKLRKSKPFQVLTETGRRRATREESRELKGQEELLKATDRHETWWVLLQHSDPTAIKVAIYDEKHVTLPNGVRYERYGPSGSFFPTFRVGRVAIHV
jgi:hypothetical protein